MPRNPSPDPDLVGLVRWAKAHNVLDEFADEVAAWEAGVLPAKTLWSLIAEDLQEARYALRLHDACPLPLPKGLDEEGVLWGNDAAGQVIWLPASFADGHVLIVGGSTSGKTSLVFFWADQWPTASSSSST